MLNIVAGPEGFGTSGTCANTSKRL